MPDWKNIEVVERLMAALVASNGSKVDCQAVARYFNDSYDTVEKKFRIYKKAAQVLTEEAEAAGRLDMNMKKSAGGKKTTATPKKDAVKSGRVTKRTTKTSSKLKRANSDDEDEEDEDMGNAGTTAGAADEEV
ncbi:hypothetical protein KCU99_g2382, partial [Aureobasidium melanogenum]